MHIEALPETTVTLLLNCSCITYQTQTLICDKFYSIYSRDLKMISSPYCAVSEPHVYKHYKRLTRWNGNRCYSLLRIKNLIFETFQTLFQTASLIFTAV